MILFFWKLYFKTDLLHVAGKQNGEVIRLCNRTVFINYAAEFLSSYNLFTFHMKNVYILSHL